LLIPMQRPQQDRPIETSSSRLCHIYLTVPYSHLATFMPMLQLKRHYAVAGLAVMKCKKRCMHGFGSKLNMPLRCNQEACGLLQKVFELQGDYYEKQ
jgi:hypothetical protein